MNAPNLSPRLETVANYIRKGKMVVDVGTDHAHLPCYLVAKEICPSAIAADIAKGPISLAKKTVLEYNLENKVELVLSDGLKEVEKTKCEEIIIAGVGAETIISILNYDDFIRTPNIHLILQPMTKAGHLRKYLYENGFSIDDETAVREKNKIYTVMSVYYTGEKNDNKEENYYIGGLKGKTDSNSIYYKNKVANTIRKQADGLLKQNFSSKKAMILKGIAEKIMKE